MNTRWRGGTATDAPSARIPRHRCSPSAEALTSLSRTSWWRPSAQTSPACTAASCSSGDGKWRPRPSTFSSREHAQPQQRTRAKFQIFISTKKHLGYIYLFVLFIRYYA
nr:uncharacterized protein LOC113825392 [Penaeus vannamei]